MSDYFGALLRAAGAAAAVPGVPAAPPPFTAGATGGGGADDLVEQALEVEAGARAVPAEPLPEPRPEPAVRSSEAAIDGRTTRPARERPEPAPAARPTAMSETPADAAPAPRPAPLRPKRDDPALAHPVVQAALRWVAADPRAVLAADPRPATDEGLPRAPLRPDPADRPAPTPSPAPLRPAMIGRSEPAKPPTAAPEIELTLPVAPRPRAPSVAERAEARVAAAPTRPIEVHIGTIHAAVDAPPRTPPPPPVAAPAAPRQEPPAAARDGFARLRLPRF